MQQIAQFFQGIRGTVCPCWCAATRRSADEAKKVYQNIPAAAPRDQGLCRLLIFLRRKALRLFRTRPSLFRPVSAL